MNAAALIALFGRSDVSGPILLSVKVIACVLPLLAAIGVPLGYALGRRNSPMAAAVDFLVSLPLVFPPIATGFILLILFGRQGVLGKLLHAVTGDNIVFSFSGVVFAAFVSGLPLVVKTIQATVRNEIEGYIEAAYMLGKSRLTTFFRIVLPLLRRGILSGICLAMARALGDVGITIMLGGNIIGRTNTIALEVYNSVFVGEFDRAFLLTGLLGVLSLVVTRITRVRSWD